MADRENDRQSRGNRGRDQSKSRGDNRPKQATFKREFEEPSGTRDAVELTVKISKNSQRVHGEKVWFWLGTEKQRRQKPLEETVNGAKKLWEISTVSGYAMAKIDLSGPGHEKYTHITAVHGDYDWEETKPLPIGDTFPVRNSIKSDEKKARRFAVRVDTANDEGRNLIHLTCKNENSSEGTIVLSAPFTFEVLGEGAKHNNYRVEMVKHKSLMIVPSRNGLIHFLHEESGEETAELVLAAKPRR